MILNRSELDRKSLLPDKTTAIIATSQAPLEFLAYSVISLLLYSDPTILEHITIVINGPDPRTGDTSLQDRKQKFVETLRGMKWHGRDMPLTLSRVWSRQGHAESIEQGLAFLHTSHYLLMHDDVVVRKSWGFQESCDIVTSPPLIVGEGVMQTLYAGQPKLGLPHMNTEFLLCRKASIQERWTGYHVKHEFDLRDYPEFLSHHNVKKNLKSLNSWLNQDIGSWVAEESRSLKIGYFDPDTVYHFRGVSWNYQEKCKFEQLAQDVLFELRERVLSVGDYVIPGIVDLFECAI